MLPNTASSQCGWPVTSRITPLTPDVADAQSLKHKLALVQDCNLVLYNGNLNQTGPSAQSAVYSSATYDQGTPPCTANVSSAGGGSLKVNDSKGVQLFERP